MPKADAVCSLSSDSGHEATEGPAPKESQGRPSKKRKVTQASDPVQQFVEPELFERLKSYREHWFDLGKLDQDAFDPRPIFLHLTLDRFLKHFKLRSIFQPSSINALCSEHVKLLFSIVSAFCQTRAQCHPEAKICLASGLRT